MKKNHAGQVIPKLYTSGHYILVQYTQGSFCVYATPMRDDVTL